MIMFLKFEILGKVYAKRENRKYKNLFKQNFKRIIDD